MSNWKPIKTAPTGDDDFFLVCGVGHDRLPFVIRGSICKNTRKADTPEHLSLRWLTHWMPLPPPPALPPIWVENVTGSMWQAPWVATHRKT